jgi:hypothetical protein
MDRFTYALAAGVLALIVGALATAVVVRGRSSPPDLSTPAGVVLAYATAEQRGDALAAWNLLDPAVQARSDREAFLARAADGDQAYLTVEDERIDADGATVVLVRTSPSGGGIFSGGGGGYASRNTVRLARQGADWRITAPPDSYRLVPLGK